MAVVDENWTCDANDAIHITIVQPGETKPQTLSSFHPHFTYPIFGDDEQIFGYKGLIIRLRFAAHDLRPHLHISYDEKFQTVDDTVATDLLGTLKEFVHDDSLITLPEYEQAVQEDAEAKDFIPPGKLAYSYEHDGKTFEVWSGSLADPKVLCILDRAQVLVSLFIEAGTPIPTDEPKWSRERWEIFFVYEKVTPPTSTASSYSIVGYATTFRYWCLKKEHTDPNFKSAAFPFPEVSLSLLPARLRLAQFMILPSYHRAGHGNQLYHAIHAAALTDDKIVELTVEDPNEQFDALRDIADFCLLRPEFMKNNIDINIDPNSIYSQKKPAQANLTAHLLPRTTLCDIRSKFKIEVTQFAHVLEIYLLSLIPKNHRGASANLARLLVKKHKAEDPNDRRYFWWRLLVKERIYRKHKELLQDLEPYDRAHKLNETLRTIEEGYEIRLEALEGRFQDPSIRREKRKNVILDDDDEEEETEASAVLIQLQKKQRLSQD